MRLERERTALIVVDMQNGFCAGGGSFDRLGLDISMAREAIEGCHALMQAARPAGVPVIFTRYVYRADYRDGGVLLQELMPAIAEAESLVEGTWDSEIVDELTPDANDFIVDKNRYSAFYGTRLEPILTSLGVRSVVVCGVTTNMCVETTVRDAMQRDYRAFVVRDATGEIDRRRHEFALETMAFGFGRVVDVATVVGAWAGNAIEVS
jgi:ureidoacrylate peracid hydrolase